MSMQLDGGEDNVKYYYGKEAADRIRTAKEDKVELTCVIKDLSENEENELIASIREIAAKHGVEVEIKSMPNFMAPDIEGEEF